jgi:metal-responsive CopG/Arc/MetJ family transcriptional regulator
MLRVISIKINADLLWLIDRIAESEGVSRSEVIRRAIRYYIENAHGRRVIATRKIKIYL